MDYRAARVKRNERRRVVGPGGRPDVRATVAGPAGEEEVER
jgi:hypothetical protein